MGDTIKPILAVALAALYRSPLSNVGNSRPKNRQDNQFSTFGTKKPTNP